MKKIIALFLTLISSLVLVACGDTKPTDNAPTDGVQVNPNATVIKYCSWDVGTEEDNNLTRRLIKKFNQTHADIQIEVVEPDLSQGYPTFLTTMASGRNLPDVFMVESVPWAVISNLSADLTDVTSADEEWATVDGALRESITYGGHVFGIPCGQYYLGLFANYTLIDNYLKGSEEAADIFTAGNEAYTYEKLISTVKAIKKIDVKNGTGVIGINATGDMINWLPSVLDSTGKTGHFVWNAETTTFDLNSESMIRALEVIADLGSVQGNYTFSNVVANDPDNAIFGTNDATTAFTQGQVGFINSGTWEKFSDIDGVLDVEFVGYPNNRIISASDYMCISRSTKNKEAAYEVAKWLSFGYEGTMAKFDIIDANKKAGLSVTGLPIVNNEEIAEKWFKYVKLDGVKEAYEGVMSGEITLLVEGNKSTPGFLDARFNATTNLSYPGVRDGSVLTMGDYIWDVCGGQIPVSTYQTAFTDTFVKKINDDYVKTAYASIEEVIAKLNK